MEGRLYEKRWVAAGMLEAERSFRRVKGCKESRPWWLPCDVTPG